MIVEFCDGGDVVVSACGPATDGVYIPLKEFAAATDVSESLVRTWKRRENIETVTILGHVFVKKDTLITRHGDGFRPELRNGA